MKKRSLLLSVVAAFGLTTASMAQVPSYVPTNGLLSWYSFEGNANDVSGGSGNNGAVNGATLTTDRFGNANSAYNFDGINDNVLVQMNSTLAPSGKQNYTYSLWFQGNPGDGVLVQIFTGTSGANISNYDLAYDASQVNFNHYPFINNTLSPDTTSRYMWTNILVDVNQVNDSVKFFKNGIFWYEGQISTLEPSAGLLSIGALIDNNGAFQGKIDDIGIWGRSLTECEISDLYNAQLGSFSNTTVSINPTSSAISSNATLTVSTPIQNVQWQSNPGNMGWNNVVNNNTYNGSTNDTLVVSNVQLSNHNQPFRLLACGDTSNIATIQIADTCITNVTIYDTLLTTVTDTLIINTTLSLPAPNNENTILIYPNPASDHITIDNGNYSAMTGYSIKITNNAGQEVFLNAINQQQFYVDLSTWTGNGLYFVHLIDSQNNTVTVRKIVLQ